MLIATALFALNALSQVTKISEADLKAIIPSATSASSLLSRREKAVTEMFDDKALPPIKTIIFTKTFLPPNKTQSFYSSENSSGKFVDERITIGPNEYVRSNDGPWKIETPEERAGFPPPPKAISVPAPTDEIVTVYRRTLAELDTHRISFYEMEKTGTKTDKNGTYKVTAISRYWINKDGTLAELQTEIFASNSKGRYVRTVIYEYDPNIKIEAPIK